MHARMSYETYGYYMAGWNSIFSTNSFIASANFPDRGPDQNTQSIRSYIILPSNIRDNDFSSIASIGIARNVTQPENNMVGSYGYIDQTIEEIIVNGVNKPFVVEAYS